jgi:ABC-type nitrate/sulfonate/bicarbonate transport system substrate-binding protein
MRSAIAVVVAVMLAAGCAQASQPQQGHVVVGWQTPWATQGQVVQALNHTDILSTNGLSAEFKGFLSGAPLNEAALAGAVDVFFTADQPAAALMSRSPDFVIVGRLMYNRVSLYVPPSSPIHSVADLRGKAIGMPFGAAAQRRAYVAMAQAGLKPGRDFTAVNTDMAEQVAIINSGTNASWGAVDALAGFDPTPAMLEASGRIRMLSTNTVVAVVVASKSFLKREGEAAAFLRSYVQAWYYYMTNQSQTNKWFIEASGLALTSEAPLTLAASVEPNINAAAIGDLRVTLNEQDLQVLQTPRTRTI